MNDLTGKKFGRLTVKNRNPINGKGCKPRWDCLCSCGKEKTIHGSALRAGLTSSCGCLKDEKTSERSKTHGMTGGPEYICWQHMKKRCLVPTTKCYDNYGGRGIKICSALQRSFEFFFSLLGERPTRLFTLDRIENDGNYSCGRCPECAERGWPMNVRWADRKTQRLNSRRVNIIEWRGDRMPLTLWAEKIGISRGVLSNRIVSKKWPIERAMTEPVGAYFGKGVS